MKTQKQLFGHPLGLYVLFFTEFWERFAYYGMRALLVLFLVSKTTSKNGGLGWSSEDAIWLYGWYTALVYIASIPGGWLADRFFGAKRMVFIGAFCLVLGPICWYFDSLYLFYIGSVFNIIGVGALKPNISTMVGGLYPKGDERRDLGFYVFYMGINLGAFFSPLLCGYIGEKYNWHLGFGITAVGMFVGLLTFYLGQKYLVGVGEFVKKDTAARFSKEKPKSLTRQEKDRLLVLAVSFLLIIIFWGAYEQAGGLMNLYASEKTNRLWMGWEIPAAWFQSINSFFIISLGFVIGRYWFRRKMKGKESSALFKIAVGTFVMGLGFLFMRFAAIQYENEGSSAMYWLVLAYLMHSAGELCASPVALSYVTKLSPARYGSFMMGAYFAATGLGNKAAGLIGQWALTAGEKQIFTGITVFCTIITILVLIILKPLKRLSHGAEDLATD